MTFKPKQKVRILTLVGPRFEEDWSQRGTICKPLKSQLPLPSPEWFIVKFDDGGSLCIHQGQLA